METNRRWILYKGFPGSQWNVPGFSRKNKLRSRCAVEWNQGDRLQEDCLLLVKRILKLFPFESLLVEVEQGKCTDVFPDWDSYLEWLSAEEERQGRLFSKIKIFRQKRVLGLIVWEKNRQNQMFELAIYTEHNQTDPVTKACETLGTVEVRDYSLRMGLKLFKFFR